MNGKYKDTFDEIKVSEELKMNLKEKIRKENETMENNTEEPITNEQGPKRNISTWLLVGVAACLLVISCFESITGFQSRRLASANTTNTTVVDEPEDPDKPSEPIQTASGEVDKIKKFSGEEELLAISKEKLNSATSWGDMILESEDMAMNSMDAVPKSADATARETTQTAGTNSSSDYSRTNVQVENVDEEDIIKTDGKYIYVLNVSEGEFHVIDVDTQKVVMEKTFDRNNRTTSDRPLGMFLYKGKVALILDRYEYFYDLYDDYGYRVKNETNEENEEYIIDKGYARNQDRTIVEVYNPENGELKLERTVCMTGYYVSSRMIDGNLYFLTNEPSYSYYTNRRTIYLPTWEDEVKAEGVLSKEVNDIYYIENPDSTSYTNIGVINLDKPNEEMKVESIYGFNTNSIYMSTDNLYLWKTNYTGRYRFYYLDGAIKEEEEKIDESIPHDTNTTSFYRISVDGMNIKVEASGSVPGQVLNQFSLDEYNGNLRVATTRYIESRNKMNYSSETNNNLYILDKNLETIGKIEGFEAGERIYSVRFMGARGFVVTFESIDPLLTMDLSNPRDPKIVGKLEIPGVSNYMQLYDENHIIGIGEDVGDNGYGGYTRTGLKISYFDISDMSNPIEVNKLIIGDSSTSSEGEYNHKAVLLSKEKGILVIPITSYSWDDSDTRELNGSIVFNVDAQRGVSQKGILKNDGRIFDTSRTIYIGDKYYKIEPNSNIINVYDMNSLELLSTIDY